MVCPRRATKGELFRGPIEPAWFYSLECTVANISPSCRSIQVCLWATLSVTGLRR